MEHSQQKQRQRGKRNLVTDLFAVTGFVVGFVITLCLNANAQSLINPILVNPQTNGKMVAGNGIQGANTAGCSTAAAVGAICTSTITFPISFVDTNYTCIASCGNAAGEPTIASWAPVSTTTVNVITAALTAVAATCGFVQVWCWHQ